MNSIEITLAINAEGHVDLDPAESKARFWIRKGVERALQKVAFELDEFSSLDLDQDSVAAADLQGIVNLLKSEATRADLTASAWHRRGDR